ncbi:MAG TPA: Cof-type HAD-IIB family hydrolase [Candidatus Dorea intestinavium]|nr:Cof-type HAD-IIB family hydrolase [Candidatus Dorea intestinavium]
MNPKPQIKLFAFDLDGTLLTKDKTITQETLQVLDELIKREVLVVPVTGRPIGALPQELLENPGIHYIISANGARIIDQRKKKSIYEELLPVEIAEDVLTTFGKYDCIREIYYDGLAYVSTRDASRIADFHKDQATVNYFKKTRNYVSDIMELFYQENRAIDKAQGVFNDREALLSAKAELEKRDDIKITRSLANNIEVNLKWVNKGAALKHLLDYLEIKQEEVLAIGDGDNDIEMIAFSGIGVAMENAILPVKEQADYITSDNNHDGVVKAIQKYILNEENKVC